MLRIHFAGPDGHPFASTLSGLGASGGFELAGISTTVSATVGALHANDVDALIFPTDWSDILRAVRMSKNGNIDAALVVATESVAPSVLVRALACGFDGVVGMHLGPQHTIQRISEIVDGSWGFESEPSLRGLAVSHGLLVRQLVVDDGDDEQLVDLVGIGLPDDDIAVLLQWSAQRVRNRIEHLLDINELSYRTQLAVVRAASLKVPDFS